jgi:hypothetical protein
MSEASARPTPQTFDANDCDRSAEALARAKEKGGCANLREKVSQFIGWTPDAETWPTPDGQVFQDGMEVSLEEWDERRRRLRDNCPTPNGNGCGTPLAMAAHLWSTPSASMTDHETAPLTGAKGRHLEPRAARDLGAEGWPTPQPGEMDDSQKAGEKAREARATSRSGPPAPATATPGGGSSADAPTSPPPSPRRRLNPLFVSWLMGWPLHWVTPAPIPGGAGMTRAWEARMRGLLWSLCCPGRTR